LTTNRRSFFGVLILATLVGPLIARADTLVGENSEYGRVEISQVAGGLVHPWGLAFLPDGTMLVTERPGRLRRVSADGSLSKPIAGVPTVFAEGQGGLLDVEVSPAFARDALVYFSYAEPGRRGAATTVRRGRLQGTQLQEVEVVFRQKHRFRSDHHFGSRLVFDRDGHLFITLGERGERKLAQRLGQHNGKIARLSPDGSVPVNNPFVGRDDALPEIWSLGHRNVQGAALHPQTGELWTHEHGPMGGDEINIARAGRNYGWPIITHGINYDGRPIPEAEGRSKDGMEAPLHYWERSPGISGMAFCNHAVCGAWKGSLFVGAMAHAALIRLELDGERVVHEERLLTGLNERIRDVNVGPDGALYVLTDSPHGRVLRVALASAHPVPVGAASADKP